MNHLVIKTTKNAENRPALLITTTTTTTGGDALRILAEMDSARHAMGWGSLYRLFLIPLRESFLLLFFFLGKGILPPPVKGVLPFGLWGGGGAGG